MSDSSTVFEGTSPPEPPTRREAPAGATRYEEPGGRSDAPTRRDGAAASSRSRFTLPDTVSARYDHVLDLPASGGEADIARLRDRATGEEVIFKYYRTGMAPDLVALQTLREADHRYVVRLIDVHHDHDGAWEIQEYCPLGSLRDWAERRGGKLDKATLRAVLKETADALEHLHNLGSGIAHRDLKPANVLVRAEDPLDLVLADFGLAKAHQSITHLTTTVKGTWHYAAPEVHTRQSSSKSDWFALGAIIFEYFTGHKLFSMEDGTDVSEDDAKARCLARNYSTDRIDDTRWKLLTDGLLTWDKGFRWGAHEIHAWLNGESPSAHVELPPSVVPQRHATSYRPNWSPTLVSTPEALAEQFRLHWGDAASELAGRPDDKMARFLESFDGMEGAVRILRSTESPGPKLVRLQAILDPGGLISYEGTALDDTSLARRIQEGDKGDETALNWLESVLKEHILTAYAEATHSSQAAQVDFLLEQWRKQAETITKPLPPEYQVLARQAFRSALPELFAAAFIKASQSE